MLLSIQNLTVRYGTDTVLTVASPIDIEEGDRVGVIGSNGAGKTTLLKSILGLVSYEGVIRTDLRPEQMAVHMQFNEYTDACSVKYVMEAVLGTKSPGTKSFGSSLIFSSLETVCAKNTQSCPEARSSGLPLSW